MTRIKQPPPLMTKSVTDLTTDLLANPAINRGGNDYSAYLRSRDPSIPMNKVAHQTKMDVREVRKLVSAIANLPPAWRSGVVSELHKRSESKDRFGSLALSENAAKELNAFAKKAGVDVSFNHGQARPIHPVG